VTVQHSVVLGFTTADAALRLVVSPHTADTAVSPGAAFRVPGRLVITVECGHPDRLVVLIVVPRLCGGLSNWVNQVYHLARPTGVLRLAGQATMRVRPHGVVRLPLDGHKFLRMQTECTVNDVFGHPVSMQ
jgi:hypothetical protein